KGIEMFSVCSNTLCRTSLDQSELRLQLRWRDIKRRGACDRQSHGAEQDHSEQSSCATVRAKARPKHRFSANKIHRYHLAFRKLVEPRQGCQLDCDAQKMAVVGP